jgi:hypothetical protein
MKNRVFLSILIILLVFYTTLLPLESAEKPTSPLVPEGTGSLIWGDPSSSLKAGLGYFISWGSSSWAISFPDQKGRGKSVLDYNRMDMAIPTLSLSLSHPGGYGSLHIEYGKGQNANGEGFDGDYRAGVLEQRAKFDASGETLFWILDLESAFSSKHKPRWVIKPFLGWMHYKERVRMTNGTWTILSGAGTQMAFTGLDSLYEFTWEAMRLGIKGELDLSQPPESRRPQLGLKSQLAIFPYLNFQGRGKWNLRNDLKQDPSFLHEAEEIGVLGVDGRLSLVYRPLKFLELEIGGRIFYLLAQGGRGSTYFYNNTTANATLEEAKALRAGFFLQLTGRF